MRIGSHMFNKTGSVQNECFVFFFCFFYLASKSFEQELQW